MPHYGNMWFDATMIILNYNKIMALSEDMN